MAEEFSESAQRAKVARGFKGSEVWKTFRPTPPLTIIDGYPPEVRAKLQEGKSVIIPIVNTTS